MEIKTIKTVRVLMASATLLVVPGAIAQQLYITAPEYNGANGNGDQAGPYTVQIVNPSSISGLYVGADTITAGSGYSQAFQTFCIASTVDYSPDQNYYYQASPNVQPFAGEAPQGVLPYVTWGTAYLYNSFLLNPNTYGGIDPTKGTAANAADDALQEAIWTLQGQNYSGLTLGDNGLTGSALSTYENDLTIDLYNDLKAATNAATADGKSAASNGNGAYGVEALNMSTSSSLNGDWVQPQLVEIGNGSLGGSVPEPSTVFASALMLLPLGISAFRIVRKKREV
jgi:hypothetical protein